MDRRSFIFGSSAVAGLFGSGFPQAAIANNNTWRHPFLVFNQSINASNGTMSQRSGNTTTAPNRNNACGALCLLACLNYFHRRDFGRNVNQIRDNRAVDDALARMYASVGARNNSFMHHSHHMRPIARDRWGWGVTIVRSTTAAYSYQGLRDDLSAGRPVIVNVKARQRVFHNLPVEHWVVVIFADDTRVVVYDPWVGERVRGVTRSDFESAWVHTKIGLAVNTA